MLLLVEKAERGYGAAWFATSQRVRSECPIWPFVLSQESLARDSLEEDFMETDNGTEADETVVGGPSSKEQAQPAENQVDLTKNEHFRRYQSEMDRRQAALLRELQDTKQRMTHMQSEYERAQMTQVEALDPQEQVQFYRQREAAIRQEQEAQINQQKYTQMAYQALEKAGIDPRDPRLAYAWSVGPNPDGVTSINAAIAQIAITEKRQLEEEVRRRAPQAAQAAANRALVDAGVVTTSNGGGSAVVPSTEQERQLNEFRARFTRLRGQGHDTPEVQRLRSDMATKGFTFGDLA